MLWSRQMPFTLNDDEGYCIPPIGPLLCDSAPFYINTTFIVKPLKEFFKPIWFVWIQRVKFTCLKFLHHSTTFCSYMIPRGFLGHGQNKNLYLLLLFSASYKQFMTFDGEISSAYRFTANITLLGEMNNKCFSLKLPCKYWLLCTVAASQLL